MTHKSIAGLHVGQPCPQQTSKMTEAEARRELSMALGSPIYEHSITVTVKKDDGFLAEYIPKLEGFYFKHLLRFLTH
ncbi:uncharacterized protein LOC144107650 isoform X5 [Amblyomma americanum]